MGYLEFLSSLFGDGRATVSGYTTVSEAEFLSGDELIAQHEKVHRTTLPGDVPRFVESAGRWAATHFFRACQFTVYREIDEATINEALATGFEEPSTPDVHYSVDLVFRYLPDLSKFVNLAAEHDPLLGHLLRWAREWPLSSVGMPGVGEVQIDPFVENESLMQLYVDRVIATGDKSRLSGQRLCDAVSAALGMYPDLDNRIHTALQEIKPQEPDE